MIQEEAARKRQAANDPYHWDRSRPTPDHEAAQIRHKAVTDWTATEARKMMNHRSYIEASGPEFQHAADDVTKWFQHALPKDGNPDGPIVTHRSATPMVHEEDRRAVDEAIARRKAPQAQPPVRTMESRYDMDHDPRKSAVPYAQKVSDARLTGGPNNDDSATGTGGPGHPPMEGIPAKVRELRQLMATDPEAYTTSWDTIPSRCWEPKAASTFLATPRSHGPTPAKVKERAGISSGSRPDSFVDSSQAFSYPGYMSRNFVFLG